MGHEASDGGTPLHWAVLAGHEAAISMLLEAEAGLQDPGRDGSTALMKAVEADSDLMVASLLARGADPTTADQQGFTALHRAAEMGYHGIARALRKAGASPYAVDVSGQPHSPVTGVRPRDARYTGRLTCPFQAAAERGQVRRPLTNGE